MKARVTLLGNNDVTLGVSRPTRSMERFYRNAQAYELWFAQSGEGVLHSQFGRLPFRPGDYIVIPFGTTWQLQLGAPEARFFVVESKSQIVPPRRYRNQFGQLLEHAPYCERDIRVPETLETHDETGRFEVRIKARGRVTAYFYDFHPLDVAGWDGYLYPWAFNIADFEPITGSIHQPPPVHQTFEARNFVICSFVPRMLDYHPDAVPVPYNHSNLESDEVLYYVRGRFGSRRGVEESSFTLHPHGIPHGPHPGTIVASKDQTRTDELAVMVDTFRPLFLTRQAVEIDDPNYPYSWLE